MNVKLRYTLLLESLRFAWHALRAHLLRTLLSIMGVTVGIFAIVSVFSLVDSLENNVRGSIESLGDNVVFIQKWPWTFGADYPWWKYINRPVPTARELEYVARKSQKAQASCLTVNTMVNASYKGNALEQIALVGVTHDYHKVKNVDLITGRYFSSSESKSGSPVCMVGHDVAGVLFGHPDRVNRAIKINGRKLRVIGVFAREGDSFLGESIDMQIFIPYQQAHNFMNTKSNQINPSILVKAQPEVSNKELIDELTGVMRSIRRLKPKAVDNFALNQISMLINTFGQMFNVINWAGGIIGLFSILVGGFGIANIMFVSVKERTRIIGIQKALGAKQSFILAQFLFESVILCLFGGMVGLGLLALLFWGVQSTFDVTITLSVWNIIKGMSISVGIGVVAGIWPAQSAARLDPVEAIRSN